MSPISWKIRARSPLVRVGARRRPSSSAGRLEGVVGHRPMVAARAMAAARRPSRGDHPVAARSLGPVEGPVGRRSTSSSIGSSARVGDRDADRDADRRRRRAPRGRAPRRARARARRPRARRVRRRVAQQDDELLAAEARRDVVVADRRRRSRRRPREDLVADRVAVRVVERLELVDVDHQDADRVVGAPAARQQPAELVEVAPVRQPGQGVGRGLGLGGAMRVRPRQRRRRLDGGAVEEPPASSRTTAPRDRRDRTIAPIDASSADRSGAASVLVSP